MQKEAKRRESVEIRRVLWLKYISYLMILNFMCLSFSLLAEDTIKQLPQKYPYQKVLRDFISTLKTSDFSVDKDALEKYKHYKKKPALNAKQAAKLSPERLDQLFKLWLLVEDYPRLDEKRQAPSIRLPAELFTIKAIESEDGVRIPWAWPEPLVWLTNWNYSENPFYNSKALKLRAFTVATIDMMMTDDIQETSKPGKTGALRTDMVSPHVPMWAYTFKGTKRILPENVQKAFAEELKNICRRLMKWGPSKNDIFYDVILPVGLCYAADSVNDKSFTKEVKQYIEKVLKDPEIYNSAGYFLHKGGFDANFNGISLYFLTWLATISDIPAVQNMINQAWFLRSCLLMPEPDRSIVSPSHFNPQTGDGANRDGWSWKHRGRSIALMNMDYSYNLPLPAPKDMATAPDKILQAFAHRYETCEEWAFPGSRYSQPYNRVWYWHPWPNSKNMEMVNYAFEVYPKGYYQKRLAHDKKNPDSSKLPFLRKKNFIKKFGDEFVITKNNNYAAVIFTGAIAEANKTGPYALVAPAGFGGGALSVFWTKKTGSVILGRRAGMAWGYNSDQLKDWMFWPTHAVSGIDTSMKVFSSARIVKPNIKFDIKGNSATITARGIIPFADNKANTKLEYQRTFKIEDNNLSVSTSLKGDPLKAISEMYEIIPVFINTRWQTRKPQSKTVIEFQVNNKWESATAKFADNVSAIKLSRFNGAVILKFKHQRRVKLSAKDWNKIVKTNINCRNILIDLLRGTAPDKKINTKVEYSITAVTQ